MTRHDYSDWWMCVLHDPYMQHSVGFSEAVGVGSTLSDGVVPDWSTVSAAERTCAERQVQSSSLDARLIVSAERINVPKGA